MILVVGGTGQLGRKVSETLLAEGKPVRVMTRTPAGAATLAANGAHVIGGDLRHADSLRHACDGVDRVVATAHALTGERGNDPRSVDDAGNRHLIEAALEARVSHFVFVSALGATPQHPLEFFRIKHAVEARLQRSGLSYTVLRPAAFMETWAGLIGDPIIARGRTTIFGPGRNPINLMAVDDVAHYVLLSLFHPGARNRIIEIGGPENLSLVEVAETFEHISGRRAKRSHVPLTILRVMSALLHPFDGATSRLMATAVHLNTSDQCFDASETLAEFPLRLTRLEELALRRYRLAREASLAGEPTADSRRDPGTTPTQQT